MDTPLDLELTTRVVYGAGSLSQLGGLTAALGAQNALLVTDPGIVAAGHVERAEAALASAGVSVRRFEGVHENPRSADVDACLAFAREGEVDVLIGLGGGSSIDTAKGCNFVLTGGGRMEDYWGTGKATEPMLPLIAVPTTAGTGSEVQSYALISSDDGHRKMACGDPQAAPCVALLDPELTVTMPRRVTACTGLDTIAHAVESAVCTSSSALSKPYSLESFRLARANLRRVLEAPEDLTARADMLSAATFGGIAIENSMLGAAHSMANPLTSHFDLQHGQAVGMLLPHVVRFNAAEPEAAAGYAELALLAGLVEAPSDGGGEDLQAAAVEALARELEDLVRATGLPATLAECGVPLEAIDDLGREAAEQWTAGFNPRTVGQAELAGLLRTAHGAPA